MTHFLSELLVVTEQAQLAADYEALLENLGNLNAIDKSLLRPLQNVQVNGYGPDAKKSTKLKSKFGQNSEIKTSTVVGKNGDKTWTTFADNKDYLAFVIAYDGEQVMAVTDLARVGKVESGKASLFMVLNTKFFTTIMSEDEFNAQFGDKRRSYENKAKQLSQSSTEAQSFVRKILDIIVKKARAESKEVEFLGVLADAERISKHNERVAARKDRVPTPNDPEVINYNGRFSRSKPAYEVYIDNLKQQLRTKLDKLKASKAKSVDSTTDLLKLIIDEGYLDKINVKGFTYKFSNERVYMRDLIKASKGKADNWTNESYIEYELDSSDFYELRAEVRKKYKPELEKLDKEAPDFEKQYDALHDKMNAEIPPQRLKVMLQLKGGSIVPVEIKAEHR
jgi:hypothetical protein